MKSQKFKRVIVVLLVTAMAVAIPGSFAKYLDNKSYTMVFTKQIVEYFLKNTNNTSGKAIQLPYVGRYLIIAKGGDGSNGQGWDGSSSTGYDIQGGLGGTVVGIYETTKANQYLYLAPGAAGGRPGTTTSMVYPYIFGTAGDAGKNNVNANYNGGTGAAISSIAAMFSARPSSGGGGAASVVYLCDDAQGNNKLPIMIAGGGGAAAEWNAGYKDNTFFTQPAGKGGTGASNFATVDARMTSTNVSDVVRDNSFLTGYVISGLNGDGDQDEGSFGRGASDTGGTYGYVKATVGGLMPETHATAGSDIGTGGAGVYYGGGGGGGYCGGGGGAGSSINVSAGGGGGGSSFVSDLISSSTLTDDKINAIINEAKANKDGAIPTQHPSDNTAEGNGYIIVKYIGGPSGKTITSNCKNVKNIMEDVVSICKTSANTTITNNSTGTLHDSLMTNDYIRYILSGRAWKITINDGNVTIIFSGNKSTEITKNETFWRYTNGTFSSATASAVRNAFYQVTGYDYPTSGWSNGTFVLD